MEQLNRSELRKVIMTVLYQINVYETNKMEYKIENVIKECLEIENEFVNEVVYGVIEKKNEIDEIANKYLNGKLSEEETSKRQVPGSTSFVPSASGLIIASEVVRDLIS